MIKIYRKTATIRAEQFNDTNDQDFVNTCRKYKLVQPGNDLHFELPTLEGLMKINYGDWIATGIDGEHWAIADEVFKRTYAELPVISRTLSNYIELYKSKGYGLTVALCDCTDEDCPEDIPDTEVARAWLDGYQVEAKHEER